MPAASSSRIAVDPFESGPPVGRLRQDPPDLPGLIELLAQVPDPRQRRGVRHPLAAVLTVALSATLAGARSFTAIAEWASDAPAPERKRLGIDRAVPSESTIRRLLQRLDPDRLDLLIGGWMWLRTNIVRGRRVIAFDGKTLRGAKDAAGNLTHLMARLCQHTGVVVGQCTVGAKTNEIPMLPALLDSMDISGAVITADAMHCQRGTAEYITVRGGHYIFTVKGNQPKLRKQLKAIPWKQVPVLDTTAERGHGRQEKRTLKATEIGGGVLFPGAVQVLQLTRTRVNAKSGKRHTEVVYAVTSLSVFDAYPGQVADWLRGHWAIENRLHWVRDVTFDEDRSQIRSGGAPQVMATLRSTAISLLRLAGYANLAAAVRHHSRGHHRPIDLLMTS